jgi:uncharacterized protein (DUF885 family)
MHTSRIVVTWCLLLAPLSGNASDLHTLARDFFRWRTVTQPSTSDDINRVERPDGWVPDWSPAALKEMDARQHNFRQRLNQLDQSGWTRADSVDFLLLRSAIERVDFELNVVRSPWRNPFFYVQQTLGAVFELILQPPPFDRDRSRNIILRLESIPRTISYARENLTEGVPDFADLTLTALTEIEQQMNVFGKELAPLLPATHLAQFSAAMEKAKVALVAYRTWLKIERPAMRHSYLIGPGAYNNFLRHIALLPYNADDLLVMGKMEWDRAATFDQLEALRNHTLPPLRLFPSASAQIQTSFRDEREIRAFLVEKGLLDVPSWMGHYRNLKVPEYLAPIAWLGVEDDLTSRTRLGQDAVSYIPEPSRDLPYFRKASAEDPRPIIVHEGVPGHFFQRSLSWSNPDSLRREFFDSGPIEGIGFYAEEMMLQSGLFDDRPHTREIIYSFMRLRALRVEVDVKLARGLFTIDDAAAYLEQTVPMDRATAQQEAAFFASTPGQAISYQIGKIQIMHFIADAKILLKEKFDLRALHNYLWLNGNVPIALLRWEYLGLRDEVEGLFAP